MLKLSMTLLRGGKYDYEIWFERSCLDRGVGDRNQMVEAFHRAMTTTAGEVVLAVREGSEEPVTHHIDQTLVDQVRSGAVSLSDLLIEEK